MSQFDFSSFLASITPPGTAEEIDEQQVPATETVCAVVRKSYSGRRLTFHDAKLECDLRELFANDVEDSLPQLLVRTVAVQNSDNAANSELPYAKQIAVNKTYFPVAIANAKPEFRFLCYALKSGDLRIISRISNGRALFSTHNDDITGVSFLSGESNRLLVASLDQKISIMEVWEKDEDIEYQVVMSVGVDSSGSIRVAWGPQNDQLFVFALQNWVVFVQWAKVLEGYEGQIPQDGVQCEISLRSEAPTFARFLKFDAEVSFLKCHKNSLVVGTTDGMLQIWNFTDRTLQTLFSEADPEISDPIIKLQVDEGAPVRHVELLEDGLFTEEGSQDASGFCFLTVSYPAKDRANCITIKSWFCENYNTVVNFHPHQIQVLHLAVESVEDFTSLSVTYCKRENLLILAERHWMHLFVIRCNWQEAYLGFECISKFPLKQEIVSMELSEDLSLEDGVENGIDLFCMQPMIVQQYILDADLCLPEVLEDEANPKTEKNENTVELSPGETVPMSNPNSDEKSVLLSLMTDQQGALLQQSLVEMEISKPETMPIPVPESFDLELSIPKPPDPSQSSPLDPAGMPEILNEEELTLQTNFKTKGDSQVVTPQGSSSGISLNESSTPTPPPQHLIPSFTSPSVGTQSPKGSVHSRTRSEKLEGGSSLLVPPPSTLESTPEPPVSVAQDITAVAMHLLKVSQAGGAPETPLGGKEDARSDDHGLLSPDRIEKESPVLQNLSSMDPGGLPLNSDLSDLVDTLERSLSNVKRMIQVLEHKLGRAFHSVNKRLDVNFQDTLSRLDSLQSSGIRGQEDVDMRIREHTTVAMQTMLDVVQSTIQTEIKNTLRAVVGSAIQRVFAEFLSRQLSGLLNRCVENAISSSLASAVNQGLQSNFRESFSDSIVPAFESAVQNMFGQIQTAFTAGLNEHLVGQNQLTGVSQTNTILQNGMTKLADFGENALTDIAVLKQTMSSLTNDLQSMKQDLQSLVAVNSQQLTNGAGPPTAPRATPDIVISEIFTLLKHEDYENAFNKALSLSKIDVLNKIISVVDYECLFATEPCPLSQSVLLSLLNQLGCDLVTDSETKLKWIRGAVTHLDVAPSSPRVGTLTVGVLDYLISKTQEMTRGGQVLSGPLAVSAKMTLSMLHGVRNMHFST